MQVTDKDLKDSFTLLVFVDPANYKNAVDNVRRLQDITELAGPLAPQAGFQEDVVVPASTEVASAHVPPSRKKASKIALKRRLETAAQAAGSRVLGLHQGICWHEFSIVI